MKITAITRFKNGVVYETCQKLGWSIKQLADRSGVSYTALINFVALKRRMGEESLIKVQRAFGEAGIYVDVNDMCPEEFQGFGKSLTVVQTQEIDTGHLLQFHENTQAALMDKQEMLNRLPEVREALIGLPCRSRQRFELLLDGYTIPEIAEQLGETVTNTRGRLHMETLRLRRKVENLNRIDYDGAFLKKLKSEVGWVGNPKDVSIVEPKEKKEKPKKNPKTRPLSGKQLRDRERALIAERKKESWRWKMMELWDERLPYENVISVVRRKRETHGVRINQNLRRANFVETSTGVWVKVGKGFKEWTVRTCADNRHPDSFFVVISRR